LSLALQAGCSEATTTYQYIENKRTSKQIKNLKLISNSSLLKRLNFIFPLIGKFYFYNINKIKIK
jgi:hypothetical protein